MHRVTVYAAVVAVVGLGLSGCARQEPQHPPPGQEPAPSAGTETTPAAQPVEEKEGQKQQVTEATAAKITDLPVIPISQIFLLPNDDGKKLTIDEIKAFLADPKSHEPFVPEPPLGLPLEDVLKAIPEDNPMTRAKVELGRQLYFDKRLSRDSTISCATCHDPAMGWTEHKPVSTGINGQKGTRNSPTVLNRIFGKTQFWDGRAASLEEQALGPIENPIEMGFTLKELVERLKGIEGYGIQFEKVFGGISADAIGKAIAAFERTVMAGAAPYDYYQQAEPYLKMSEQELANAGPEAKKAVEEYQKHRMSDSAKRGMDLFFGEALCSVCHLGPNFSDEDFDNLGVGMMAKEPDPGRKKVTGKEEDTGAFRTPTCRNLVHTAPYMHDGSMKTLEEVIEHYVKGGIPNPYLSKDIKKLDLTEQEKKDLLAFLVEGLTGPLPDIKPPRLP